MYSVCGSMVHVMVLRANKVESNTGKGSKNKKRTSELWTERLEKRSLDLSDVHTFPDVCVDVGRFCTKNTRNVE